MFCVSERNGLCFGLLGLDFSPGCLVMEENIYVSIISRALDSSSCTLLAPSGSLIALYSSQA